MRERQTTRFRSVLQALYVVLLRAFPPGFRVEFAGEMAAVFAERLEVAAEQGVGVLITLAIHELWHVPAALLQAHVYRWQKRREAGRHLFIRRGAAAPFGVPPPAGDGRFSGVQRLLETSSFLWAAIWILLLTYAPTARLPGLRHDPLELAVVWGVLLPLPVLLLGLARGMPRWAYPYGGLIAGYTLLAAAQQQLVWLWGALLWAAVCLAVMALMVHGAGRPLPSFLLRAGASVALDWTRLSFGAFGAAPLLVLAAFDNGYVNDRTSHLVLAMVLMVLVALLYGRSRRQDQQLGTLLGGATLLLVAALLDDLVWRGAAVSLGWFVSLWAGMVALLLLPVLAVPLQWTATVLLLGEDSQE